MSSPLAATAWRIGVGVLLVYAAALTPVVITPDERSMLAVSLSVLDGGGFSVPPELGTPGADGRAYSRWYPLNSALALPFVAVARAIGGSFTFPVEYVAAPFAIAATTLVTAFGAVIVWLLALRLGGAPRDAVMAAVAYAFGTVVLLYGRTFFADAVLATIAALALWSALDPRGRSAAVGAIACGLAVLAKPTGIVVGGSLALWHLGRGEWTRAGGSAAGAMAGLAIYGAYNQARFGSPSVFGQPWEGFTLCCVGQAVTGLLASPGAGLLVYCPPAALGLAVATMAARRHAGAALMLLTAGAFIGLHAVWGQWPGGWSWGPRLLVPTLPGLAAALVLAPPALRRVVPAAIAAGLIVNAPTLVWSYQYYLATAKDRGTTGDAIIWSLAHAPVTNAWTSAASQLRAARSSDVREVVRAAGRDDDAASRAEVFRIVPVWWWMLPLVGIPRALGAGAAAIAAMAGAGLLVRAWRRCAARPAGLEDPLRPPEARLAGSA